MPKNNCRKSNRIAGLQKTSMIDWDGMLSAVVFLSGCNLRCRFCHNWELVEAENLIDEEDVFFHLENQKNWIDGVVLCGGEPLIDGDIVFFVKRLKEHKYRVKVDTNGTFPENLKMLIDNGLVDYVAMDVKTSLIGEKYMKAVSATVDMEKIMGSIDLILNSGIDFEFRTTMVPGIVTVEDVDYNLKFFPEGTKYVLQQFLNENVKDEYMRSLKPYTEEELQSLTDDINKKGVKACLRI